MSTWFGSESILPLDAAGPVEVEFSRFDDIWIDRPVVERFASIATQFGPRIAVIDKNRRLTYDELGARVHALAGQIRENSPPDRPVAILLQHDALFPVAALACFSAGRPYVPVDLKLPPGRCSTISDEARFGCAIIADNDSIPMLPAGLPVVNMQDAGDSDMIDKPRMHAPHSQTDAEAALPVDAPAVILYTSGSTGKPKGICNHQRAILQRVAEYTNSCHIGHADKILLLSSPGTIAGVREMFAALLNGATICMTDPQKEGIHHVLDMMTKEQVSLCYGVPSLLRLLLRSPGAREAFSTLRVLRTGGDITLDSDLALFRQIAPSSCRFYVSFSSTETPAVFQWFVPDDWQATGPRVPVGYPRPGVDFKIITHDGAAAQPGETGELVVRSRYLAMGQWLDGRLDAGPFSQDPEDDSLRIFHTGDLVTLRADGLWELVGRKDRMVKLRGQRVDISEIEAALRSCARVMDAAVIARRSGMEVTGLAAFVVPLDSASSEGLIEEVMRALSMRVPPYMHPAAIHVIEAIPQLPGFKPDMVALQSEDAQRMACDERQRQSTAAATLSSPLKNRIASTDVVADDEGHIAEAVKYAWTRTLGADAYAPDRAWSDTDSDSLKAIELWFYIEHRLGFKLPLDTINESATPRDLVAVIRNHLNKAATSLQEQDDSVPVVFLFPGIQSDDPPLARFRAALGKKVRFKLIDYPGWREAVTRGKDIGAIADAAFEHVCQEPPCSTYRLAGYSFGGIIAFEVAHRLVAAGHRVGFLGLLDSRRWDLTAQSQSTAFHTFLGEPRRIPHDWVKQGIAALARSGHIEVLEALERIAMARTGRLAFWFKRQLTKELRYQALVRWEPQSLDVPSVLFLSNERWPSEPEDYGWDELIRPLKKIKIGGSHSSFIQPPLRDALCASFLLALNDCSDLLPSLGTALA